ncbi:MAG: arginase family protein [Anderseniella sp.]
MTLSELFREPSIAFMGAVSDIDIAAADAVIFGAPHGTPYENIDNEPYASAPDALRKAIQEDRSWLDHWDFDLDGPLLDDKEFNVLDAGNLLTSSHDGQGNRHLIRQATSEIIKTGSIPIMLGGDDSTPIPFLEALAPIGPITVVQIDAHIDWRDERYGEPLGFSSTMRRASEMAHVTNIVQVGMRGVGSARREEVELAKKWGAKIVPARDVLNQGIEAAMEHISVGANCVITLDCDGLDSSIMPAVMAPSPGGLTYSHVIDLVEAITTKSRLVGFDMIEFVPQRDINGTATFTAARIVANVIGRLARAAK